MQPALQPESPEPVDAAIASPVVEAPVHDDDVYRMERALRDVVRATQSWVQFGTLGFAVLCILIGAVERLFGR